MILGLDTDVLVSWAMKGAPRHLTVRKFFLREVRRGDVRLGVTPQVLHEFLHVTTDPRRFAVPLPMERAVEFAGRLWDSMQVERILPSETSVQRTLDLMASLNLGRKRILDTALATTLESAGVRRLATFNGADFAVFSFLQVVVPG